ncbi:uncharacterized protein LOC143296310 isoform X2 [Babylonia areolata]|uniref:uncharacterized protein LOC143296310 isoform X2 n=1 Tax=Babylonia areolata TaxID=304850 RepID=UPI003FD4FB9D
MDDDKASRFISSLVKSIQALCNGFVEFSNSIEVVGHIHLNIDRNLKLDYVLTEEVSKSVSEGSTVFSSHSYHSQPPPSLTSKSANDTSNSSQKSRKNNEADPLGLSALPREVPNTSRSEGHSHSSNRVSESSNSSHSFSRNSDSESLKHENNRSSCQIEDSSNKRRKMGPLSQNSPSPAAKRSRPNDFSSGSRTVIKEQGFEVIEIKEEPEEEPAVFFGNSATGQDIQTPDFSNVVMESLDRVNQIEGSDLVADGGGGDGMGGPQQPVFPVMFHQSDGMQSSSGGPVPGPSSDPQSAASTSGAWPGGQPGVGGSLGHWAPTAAASDDVDRRRQHRAEVIRAAVDYIQQTGLPACRVCTLFDIPQATLYRHLTRANKLRPARGAGRAGGGRPLATGTGQDHSNTSPAATFGETEPLLPGSQKTDSQCASYSGGQLAETPERLSRQHCVSGEGGVGGGSSPEQREVKAFREELSTAQDIPDIPQGSVGSSSTL